MLGNWVRMTTATTGTGNLTLSSVSGYPTIADCFANSERFQYSILSDSDGKPVECGIGYVTSGTTLVREKIIATYVSSTYSEYPSAASLSGTSRIIVTPLANGVGPSLTQIHSGATRYYALPNYQNALNTKGLTANVTMFIAGPVATTSKVTGMACEVTSGAGTGSNKLRMGIYSVASDGTPGAVIAETADATALTGLKTPSFPSAIILPSGHYYFGVISDVGPTLRASAAGSFRGMGPSPMGASNVSDFNGFGTDNNGGSTFSGWSTMPAYVGMSFAALSTDYPPNIHLVLA